MADQHKAVERRLEENSEELAGKSTAYDTLDKQLTETKQHEVSLTALLEEKQGYIDSLEEKHLHSREALEHYQESVKEQRDQDQRRHEQQIQQLQAEIRTLNQTISVKQGELTRSLKMPISNCKPSRRICSSTPTALSARPRKSMS